VALIRTDVSEELRFLQNPGGVTSQKTAFFTFGSIFGNQFSIALSLLSSPVQWRSRCWPIVLSEQFTLAKTIRSWNVTSSSNVADAKASSHFAWIGTVKLQATGEQMLCRAEQNKLFVTIT
jgi:hypothetical protein